MDHQIALRLIRLSKKILIFFLILPCSLADFSMVYHEGKGSMYPFIVVKRVIGKRCIFEDYIKEP